MDYPIKPIQKIVFLNNKGGVGKTTLSFNVACKMADMGYKVLLVDADPQCNLTLLALGAMKYEELGLFSHDTIYSVFEPLILGTGDVQLVKPRNLRENLDIIPGHLNFGDVDDLLAEGYAGIIGGTTYRRGFMIISAFQRYLFEMALKNKYQVIIIDVSPSFTGSLNKNILLSSDFFVTICKPDLFSKQGLINLKEKIMKRKGERDNIEMIAQMYRNEIPISQMLSDHLTYLGYIINEYNVYAEKMIVDHDRVVQDIHDELGKISVDLSRNGLIQLSSEKALGMTQDYGRIPALGQEEHKPLYEFENKDVQGVVGSVELLEKCKVQIDELVKECVVRLSQWGR